MLLADELDDGPTTAARASAAFDRAGLAWEDELGSADDWVAISLLRKARR